MADFEVGDRMNMITKKERIETIKLLGQYLIDHAELIIPGTWPTLVWQTLILNLSPNGDQTIKLFNTFSYGTDCKDIDLNFVNDENVKRFDINEQLNMMKMNIQNAEEALGSLQYEFKKLKEML